MGKLPQQFFMAQKMSCLMTVLKEFCLTFGLGLKFSHFQKCSKIIRISVKYQLTDHKVPSSYFTVLDK